MSYIKLIDYFSSSKDRKDKLAKLEIYKMIRRTLRMFSWTIPNPTITERNLELFIQTRGFTGIVKNEGSLYAILEGALGGIPNPEYMPSNYIASNPYLKMNANSYEIYGDKKNVVIIPNDSLYMGLLPILSMHAQLLAEIQLTKRCIIINHRTPAAFTAPNNNAKADIDDYLKKLENGDISAILDKNLFKQISTIVTSENSGRNTITQVLEMEQYQKAAMFNDVGLQMNYNMKRETITSSEAQLGEGALLPLPDDMMDMRKLACKQIKETFDEDWNVEFSSAWADLRKSIQVEMQIEENEANVQTSGGNNDERTESGESGENVEESEHGESRQFSDGEDSLETEETETEETDEEKTDEVNDQTSEEEKKDDKTEKTS
jgi:hypothetical protein